MRHQRTRTALGAAALGRKKRVLGARGQGGKLFRSEVVTVRFDPRLRYLAELAARKQRRTVSSYIEWAVEQSLTQIKVTEAQNGFRTIADESFELWDVDEADRFVKLASLHPELLTHNEQILWKLIRENKYVHHPSDSGPSTSNLEIECLRQHWAKFVAVAEGTANKSILPDELGNVEPLSNQDKDTNKRRN
jgi:hypothetical protein